MKTEEDIVENVRKIDDIYKLDIGINMSNNKEKDNKLNMFFLKDEFIIKKR